MLPDAVAKNLYRILLGYYYIYVDDIKYKILYPSLDIKYEAELLYDKILEDNKYEKIYLTDDEIKIYLKVNKIWSPSDDTQLKDCEKFLEDCKVNLYLEFNKSDNKKQHQKNIIKATKDLETLLLRKNSFNYLTIHDHATSLKNEFILMHCIYLDDKLVFHYNNYDTLEYNKLQSFVKEILDQTIKPNELRLIAKSDLWKSYAVSKNLETNILHMNDDMRHLINLHHMYDNIRQHPECPSQDIIDDDDALDGWFIHQNRKSEKEKKKNNILNKFGKNIKNSGEVFLMANNQEEVKDIYDLNDLTTKQNIKELINIGKNNTTDWQNLPFVQRDLRHQIQEKTAHGKKRI